MSSERALQPGPWRKTPVWRGGAFLLGLAVLLQLLDWLSGGFVDIGTSRLALIAFVGFLMSIPYGWAASHGRAPAPPPARALVPQAHVTGEKGATYVIVEQPGRAGRGVGREPRPRELGPGWWALYTVLWRCPLLTGDYILSGFWQLLARVWGFNGGPRLSTGQLEGAEDLPAPDQDTF